MSDINPLGGDNEKSGVAAEADLYSTVVVRHRDLDAAKAFIKLAHASWPFLSDDAPTRMTAISIGDMMSVSDAVQMALECNELGSDESIEFARDLSTNCFSWAQCLAYAETEWELAHRDGKFVEMEPQP